ncbi:MAG: septum site-determining protein MinC [Alphaproteobacteria bacterium]|nr:septum site-determining protein MinC [Alphaproteobacteria bacterium]
MSTAARPRSRLRVRGRSFIALVLAPEPPLAEWLDELDAQMQRSPAYFAGKPVVADLTALAAVPETVAGLFESLAARGIRLVGIEGIEPAVTGLDLPPLLTGGRALSEVAEEEKPRSEPASLLLDMPVRSGQSVVFGTGDVTIIGSVASGAEVVAGGSVHIYGTLRGRAVAGVAGNGTARIFCRRLEAELLAIDGLYRTADDIEPQLRGKPAQAWLAGDSMVVAGLD